MGMLIMSLQKGRVSKSKAIKGGGGIAPPHADGPSKLCLRLYELNLYVDRFFPTQAPGSATDHTQ
jgi:hypothetical protein